MPNTKLVRFSMRITKFSVDRRTLDNRILRYQTRWITTLSKFTRTSMRSSIRRRKRPSKPGQTPTNQTGFLKKFILYKVDKTKPSAVIGVKKTSNSNIPEVLDKGGTSIARPQRRNRKSRQTRRRIRKRPYVNRALVKAIKDYDRKRMKDKL